MGIHRIRFGCHDDPVSDVATFYEGPGELVAAIGTALDSAGVDRATLQPADLAPIDEFHIRGREATLQIIDALEFTSRSHVIDLGSGLGGPARTIAEVTGSSVTGIDLTPQFCEVATALSEWTGLSDRTRFLIGDATDTGLPTASADAAVTIHVAMNIADKAALYAEAWRLIRPGGRFVVYDVLQGEGGEVRYPVPWATDPSTSFLATPDQMRDLLTGAGFTILEEDDSSDAGLAWFQELRERATRQGPAPVTFAAFLGADFPQMVANQVANLAERRIRTVMFTCLRAS